MRFSFPTRIEFGAGTVAQLPEFVAELGVNRPLVVTDAGLTATGLVDRAMGYLPDAVLFDGVEPNPVEENILSGAELYRNAGCDGIVGLGGGSSLDAGKLIGLAATHDGPLAEFDDNLGGDKLIESVVPPIIAIPTTAGTGSEVGRSGVVTLKATDRKTVIFSPYLMPSIALCDPELTLALPQHITASTGADALTHSLEAYLATGFHPMCDGIALHGASLAFQNLSQAVWKGREDIVARGNMMMAAAMGGTAFQKGLGATHSLAHPLSTVAGVPHGLANAILLPHVLRFNAEAVPGRMKEVGVALGLDVLGQNDRDAAEVTVRAIERLLRDIEIPTHLSDQGITDKMLETLTTKAMEDGCHLLNPRSCTKDDFLKLYRQAL